MNMPTAQVLRAHTVVSGDAVGSHAVRVRAYPDHGREIVEARVSPGSANVCSHGVSE